MICIFGPDSRGHFISTSVPITFASSSRSCEHENCICEIEEGFYEEAKQRLKEEDGTLLNDSNTEVKFEEYYTEVVQKSERASILNQYESEDNQSPELDQDEIIESSTVKTEVAVPKQMPILKEPLV